MPVLQFLSLCYDFFWLFFLQDMSNEGAHEEGGLESSVKGFAITISYIQFFFKILLLLVLWKISYNFLIDVRQAYEAPRIIKIMKIVDQFAPEPEYQDPEMGE